MWTEAGLDPVADMMKEESLHRLADVAWALWKEERDSSELARTKTWSVIESLCGMAAVRATAPTHDLARIVIGARPVERQ